MQEENNTRSENEKEEPRLQVDEDWKSSVAEEKQRLSREKEGRRRQQRAAAQERQVPPEPSIQVFMAGLYTQTLIALGALENPLTRKKETSIAEAAYLIDTIEMLQKKTEGNLTSEETAYVQNILYDLRMRYVGAAGKQDDKQDDAHQAQHG